MRMSSNVHFAVELPVHWNDMKKQEVCLVELQPGHVEYDTVAKKFNQTCSQFKIQKVSLLTWSFSLFFFSFFSATWSFLMMEIRGVVVLEKHILIHFLSHF